MFIVDRDTQERREAELLAPYGMKSSESRGRRYPDEEHRFRTCFQRDRDRVIHSSSFRRLEYKTQVFVNHEGDNYRTRLTHSLEGAQIGRSVARVLGLNEELTECLILGHDLGHTPFGHSGERVMDNMMRKHGGFEHNRQTLRILEVLEERYPEHPGLNLTWEVREGIIKHDPESDGDVPEEFAPGEPPTLEAQLVDFVDEIAYNNHDIDDGLTSGMFSVEQIRKVALFRETHDRITSEGLSDRRMVRHRVVRRIIDRCARDLTESTLKAIEDAGVGSVADVRAAGQRLVCYSPEMAEQVRELKDFLLREMYRHYRVVRMGKKAGRVLSDLFESLVNEPGQLPPRYQALVERDGVERAVCDYIAGMTDRFALQEHGRLFNPTVRV